MYNLKIIKLTFFLIHINFILNQYYVINKDDFFKELDDIKKTPQEYNEIINSIKTIFQNYVFLDIAKSPPKIEEIENYHTPYDLFAELNKINTNETDFYNFYQQIISATMSKTKDGHIAISYNNNKKQLYNAFFVFPIIPFVSKNNEGDIKMYGEISLEDEYYEYFKNGNDLLTILKNNRNTPIKKINGKNPFNFIADFFIDYYNLRSRHAIYTTIFNNFPIFYLCYFPIKREYLDNFTIEYENDVIISTDLIIIRKVPKNLTLNNYKKINIFNSSYDSKFENYLMNKLKNHKKRSNLNINFINEVIKFQNKYNITNNFFSKKIKKFKNRNLINWNVSLYDDSVKCFVDDNKKMNVLVTNIFYDNDNNYFDQFILTYRKCFNLFTKNEYPLTIILDENGGGDPYLATTLAQLTQKTISFIDTITVKVTDILEHHINESIYYLEIDTCDFVKKEDFLNNFIDISYGHITSKITKPYFYMGDWVSTLKYEKKPVKFRKPTEIIVYTDGFSFSSGSCFAKILSSNGGAIFVGYHGNPLIDKKEFDDSQSNTGVIQSDSLEMLYKKEMDFLNEQDLIIYQFPIEAVYPKSQFLNMPFEYSFKAVDERIELYEKFDEENYDFMIDEANRIINQYKTDCNVDNPKLVLFNDECTFSDDKHGRGGYGCGSDGKWNYSLCVKTYCEEGYYMDLNDNMCKKNLCFKHKLKDDYPKFEDDKDNNGFPIWAIIIIIIVICLIIIGVILLIKKYKKDKISVVFNSSDMIINKADLL